MTLQSAVSARLAAFFDTEIPAKLAVAVSGGGDSMALLHLAQIWAKKQDVALHVVTVDHGLRAESAQEAAAVKQAAAALGLPHQTLKWAGYNGQGNLQDAARMARRKLIEDWAAGQGISNVLTGHTADDQAETVLMRLARGSGVDGLAGMAVAEQHRLRWLRLLLDIRRADLRDYLCSNNIPWVDDPSNDDTGFDRVKARQMLDTLAELGLSTERLSETARHMQAARQVLDGAMIDLARRAVTQNAGDLLIDSKAFARAPQDTRTRLLARALMWASSNPYRPRFAPLTKLAEAQSGTLHGCHVLPGRQFRVIREYQAVRDLSAPTNQLWDTRWQLTGPHAPDLEIRALGESGLRACPDRPQTNRPRAALLPTPAIWRGETLISAPLLGFNTDWCAKLTENTADFHESMKSH